MKYLALYRKYRPDTFEKVVGQEHIVRILSAQAESGSIGHAYLFCGARGTGKTSVAKIFARAINCLNPVKGSPCNKCQTCNNKGSANMDILEIDAASNNKVEDIREIIDNSQYPPVNGKYKVYIVDEVHMLTAHAFNALLKTLEEPPSHAVFILATTEVYKLPATILSRCMRFDFRLISTAVIAALLKDVFNDIGKPFEEGAITEIARAGEGSVRDALSIADTCLSYSAGKLKQSDVLELLAASDRGKVAELCDKMLSGDAGGLLKGIEDLTSAGKSISVLNKDLLMFLRDLSIIKNCPQEKDLLLFPYDIIEEYKKNINSYDIGKILRCIEIISSIETELRYSLHPRIIFEAAALKCAVSAYDRGEQSFEARIFDLEKSLKDLKENNIITANNTSTKKETTQDKKTDNKPNKAVPLQKTKPEYEIPAVNESDAPPEYSNMEPPPEYEGAQSVESLGGQSQIVQADKKAEFKKMQGGEKSAERVFESASDSQSGGDTAQSIWGSVISTLRKAGAGLLYTMCGELKAAISGKDFIIITDNDMAYDILSMPKNKEKLQSIINDGREYNVTIKKKSEIKSTDLGDIEKLRELSGGKLIIKD